MEWLWKEIFSNSDIPHFVKQLISIDIDKAKQLERQQIEDAFDEGNPNGFIDKTGYDYFTQTYEQ